MKSGDIRDSSFEDLAAFALNALDEDERAAVEALLAESAEARSELRELLEGAESLGALLPAVEMPPGMRGRVMAVAGRDGPINTVDGLGERRPSLQPDAWERIRGLFRPARLALASAVAALIAAAALAGFFGIQTSNLQQETERLVGEVDSLGSELITEKALMAEIEQSLASFQSEFASNEIESGQREAEISNLRQTNEALQNALRDQMWLTYVSANRSWQAADWLTGGVSAPKAHATIVVKQDTQEAALMVAGLTQLQPERVYQLWLTSGEEMTPVVSFQVNEAGAARVPFTFSGNIFSYDGAVVTVETGQNSLAPSSYHVLGTESR